MRSDARRKRKLTRAETGSTECHQKGTVQAEKADLIEMGVAEPEIPVGIDGQTLETGHLPSRVPQLTELVDKLVGARVESL